jgi:hypothetical protein
MAAGGGMTGLLSPRAKWLAVGLLALTGAGLALMATREIAPIAQPMVEAPACTGCDARHARLTDLRAAQPEDGE